MAIDYYELRKIALDVPEIQKLLIERREIEQKSKEKVTFTRPKPHLTPSNDKYFPKKHTIDKGKIAEVQKQAKKQLKANAHKIEIALHQELKKQGLEKHKGHFKEMKVTELVTFIEKGRGQVLEDRKTEKKQTQQPKRLEESQEDFNQKVNTEKSLKPINRSQDKMSQKIAKQQKKHKKTNDRLDQAFNKVKQEFEENKKRVVEKDLERGFSR